jgi:hypothetical protein
MLTFLVKYDNNCDECYKKICDFFIMKKNIQMKYHICFACRNLLKKDGWIDYGCGTH